MFPLEDLKKLVQIWKTPDWSDVLETAVILGRVSAWVQSVIGNLAPVPKASPEDVAAKVAELEVHLEEITKASAVGTPGIPWQILVPLIYDLIRDLIKK